MLQCGSWIFDIILKLCQYGFCCYLDISVSLHQCFFQVFSKVTTAIWASSLLTVSHQDIRIIGIVTPVSMVLRYSLVLIRPSRSSCHFFSVMKNLMGSNSQSACPKILAISQHQAVVCDDLLSWIIPMTFYIGNHF